MPGFFTTAIGYLFICVNLWLNALFAQPKGIELWAKITTAGAQKRLDLIIADLNLPKDYTQGLEPLAKKIKAIITADLDFSLYFNIITLDSNKNYQTIERKVDFANWAKTGAQVLLAGDIFFRKGNTFLKIRLYDLLTYRNIGTKEYPFVSDIRSLAHTISDDIIKLLTGEEGVSRTKIAFSIKRKGNKELALVDYDGFGLSTLTTDGRLKLFPEWSPKGDRIAYCSYDKGNLNLYIFDLNTKSSKLICANLGLNTTPAFSPDGNRLAVALSEGSDIVLYSMTSEGKSKKRITYSSSINISPTWSPSGNQLAFVSDRTGSPQIYIVNADGTDLRRLTFEGYYNTSPAWSPRGDLIAYVSRETDGSHQIYITDINGENRMRLTSFGNNEEPTWSPDGLHLAFSSNRTGIYEIYLMHWNGMGQRMITNTGGAFSPSWSPIIKR